MRQGNERPINSTAARVVASGEHFEYRQLVTEICSPLPLVVKPTPEGCDDLAGVRFGRLIVVGRADMPKNRWVCKCICGNYCVRGIKAVCKGEPDAACAQCYLQAVSKRHEYIRRTGREKHTREFL